MSLAPGTRFGPYEVIAPLGAGGMGEVYRARDTRLNRDVALKVLPAEFAHDLSRRQRFETEARAVAALNHANIVSVYDVGENFLVTELVEGQPLSRLQLPQRLAIDLAIQIADGLAAAHAAGVTHRDLKPQNIMVTPDDRAKILDFGLAKMAQPAAPGSPLSGVPTETQSGMVMGTVGYMSPEQAKGLVADHRSDIFSFGVVLYEMLAGRRAFSGDSSVEVISAILRDNPPDLPESVATGLRQIVAHCLEKNPDRRFQSARDLSFVLQSVSSSSPVVPPKPPQRRRLGLIAAAAIAIVALLIVSLRLIWPTPEPPLWTGGMLGGPEMSLNPRLSPDGHLLAFAAMVDGLTQVAVMKPESGNWSILTRDRARGLVGYISWSPDGARVYYDRSTGLRKSVFSVPVLGGEERLVLENADHPEALSDGTLIVTMWDAQRKRHLDHYSPDTGKLQQLPVETGLSGSQNTAARAYSDGKSALVWGRPSGKPAATLAFYQVDLASGSTTRVSPPTLDGADVTAFALAPDGKVAFAAVHSGTLTRVSSFPIAGAAFDRVLFTVTSWIWFLDAGADGSIYAGLMDRPAELARFAVDGTGYEKLASFPLVSEDGNIIAVLPDGRVVIPIRPSGQDRLVLVEKGKDPAPLVNTTEETTAPLTACGPSEVAFMIGPAPRTSIAFTEPAAGRVLRKLPSGHGLVESISCSPDGNTTYFAAGGAIWSMPSSGGDPRKVREGDSVLADPSGRRLLVLVRQNPRFRVFSVPLNGGAEREIRIDSPAPVLAFYLLSGGLSADGRLLLPLHPSDSWFNPPAVLDTATGRVTRIPSDNQSDHRSMAWTPDGHVIALKNGLRANFWKFQQNSR